MNVKEIYNKKVRWNSNRDKAFDTLKALSKYKGIINKFAKITYGGALTIYRDGHFSDIDVDFVVDKEKMNDVMKFIQSIDCKLFSVLKFKGEIVNIQIFIDGVNIDFDRTADYLGDGLRTAEIQYKPTKKAVAIDSIKFHEYMPSDPKVGKYLGWNYIADDEWFRNKYGPSWNTKLNEEEYRKELKKYTNTITTKKKKILADFELEVYL